jgi:hypothetical protein
MIDAVPAFEGMDSRLGLSEEDYENMSYSDNTVLDQFGEPVNGYPTAEDSTNINSDTLMDRVGLGMLSSLGNLINKYMFGFIEILQAIFGAFVSPLIFTSLKYLLGILYALTMIELFTGKNILGD